MKKLMFAAAAIAAGAAMADVTSANIVGYANKDLRQGFKMVTPMFVNIEKQTGIKLADITVNGYPEYKDWMGGTSGEVNVKVLNYMGATEKDANDKPISYFFYDDMTVDPDFGGFGPGWYTEAAAEKVDADKVIFDAGIGLWVSGVDQYNVLCNGQVITGNAVIPLRSGFLPCGNPFATSVLLNNMSVAGYPEYKDWMGGTSGEVNVKVLNYMGATEKDANDKPISYFFYDDMTVDPDFGGFGPGWYTEAAAEKVDAEAISFAAGDGLWVSGVDGYFLNIKTPLADLNK